MDTTACCAITALFMFMLHPETPAEPSISTVVPSDLRQRNQVAVPLLSASESGVMALAVRTPATGAPKAGLPNLSSARSVWLVITHWPVEGWVRDSSREVARFFESRRIVRIVMNSTHTRERL